MQDIVKTIAQDPRDEKQPLFAFSSRFFLLSILAFFIIAATETYHRNRYGLPGTIYVMGYGSWVYAITWSIVFFTARRSTKRIQNWLAINNQKIVNTVTFSDDFVTASSGDFFFGKYPWTYLTFFWETKRLLTLCFGTNMLLINMQYFTPEERRTIIGLLKRKTKTPSQEMQDDDAAENRSDR